MKLPRAPLRALSPRLILTSAIALTSLVWGAAAPAESFSYKTGRGTYCNAATVDGFWGFIFSPADVFTNCAAVRDGLEFMTPYPIAKWQRGRYWLFGFNSVQTDCDRFVTNVYGYGDIALQNAFDLARRNGARYCLFWVY